MEDSTNTTQNMGENQAESQQQEQQQEQAEKTFTQADVDRLIADWLKITKARRLHRRRVF